MTKQEAIDRLRDLLVPVILDNTANPHPQTMLALEMAIETLKQQQEICYCKDCEIRDKDGYCMRQMTLNLITMVEDTDFCSWGERGEK